MEMTTLFNWLICDGPKKVRAIASPSLSHPHNLGWRGRKEWWACVQIWLSGTNSCRGADMTARKSTATMIHRTSRKRQTTPPRNGACKAITISSIQIDQFHCRQALSKPLNHAIPLPSCLPFSPRSLLPSLPTSTNLSAPSLPFPSLPLPPPGWPSAARPPSARCTRPVT